MDPKELQRLRDKYEGTHGGDVFDPTFKKVADVLFKESDKRKFPYEGIPTILDARDRSAEVEKGDFSEVDFGLIGVPMDLGVTNRPGARFGPRAVRAMERIGPYNHALKVVPTAEYKVADLGDVPMESRYSLDQSIADIEAFYHKVVAAGVVPITVGGDHSITHPILRALGKDKPVGLVHIDAHCDTAGPYEGAKFHHGGPFRQAVLDGVLDPTRTIQIGIRGSAEFVWEFSYDSGMTVIHAEEVDEMGTEAVIDKIKQVVGDEDFYISFDVDGLDPVYTPGTGTPEVGGLTPREAQRILRGLAGMRVIGGDMVEIAPQYDTTTNTVQTGGQMLFEILCLACLAPRS